MSDSSKSAANQNGFQSLNALNISSFILSLAIFFISLEFFLRLIHVSFSKSKSVILLFSFDLF
jgi:hypothetical protein